MRHRSGGTRSGGLLPQFSRHAAQAPLLRRYQRLSYFSSVWNVMDVIFLTLVGYVGCLMYVEDQTNEEHAVNHAASLSLLLCVPRLLQTIRGHKFLAFTTTVVIQAFSDIAPFAVVMVVIVITSALAFMMSPAGHDFDMLSTYALLLGDFEQQVFPRQHSQRVSHSLVQLTCCALPPHPPTPDSALLQFADARWHLHRLHLLRHDHAPQHRHWSDRRHVGARAGPKGHAGTTNPG